MKTMRRAAWLLLACCALACEQEDPPAPRPRPPKETPEEPEARRELPPGWPPKHEDDKFGANREWMVRTQIKRRGVTDERTLKAMLAVPRHRFVPSDLRRHAYEDGPLGIGYDQTISQPYIVASMTELLRLRPGMKVLEIGTGSGYQAAVLAQITPWVWTIEIKGPLHERAKGTLKRLGYTTVKTRLADGYYGWKAHAPFDAVIVTAAAPQVPPPLVEQLKPGGRMVIPVGPPGRVQSLRLITKDEKGRVRSRSLYAVRFVPMTGAAQEKAPPD